MSRARYGAWGALLDDYEFACALAAAGVAAAARANSDDRRAPHDFGSFLPADRLRPWPWRDPLADIVRAQEAGATASAWAQAWQQWSTWPRPRLAIAPEPFGPDPVWISQVLLRCALPYVAMEAGAPATSWRFPIRVGVLDTAAGRAFRDDLVRSFAGSAWREHLIEPVVVGRERVRCDILVVAGPPLAALVEVLERVPVQQVRAATVLVGGEPAGWDPAGPEGLAHVTGAWAVGIGADAPDPDRIVELCRDLSHNLPFEEALQSQSWHGVLVARTDAVGRHTAARRALATARQLRRIAGSPDVNDTPDAARLAAEFLRVAAEGAFESESGEATDLLELERRAAPMLRSAAAERHLQARISAADQPQEALSWFRREARHRIDIRIGADGMGWLAAPEPFPEDPMEQGEPRRLVVLLSEPDLLPRPLADEIVLPSTGTSTTATFELTTGVGTTAVDARLIVLAGNRVLQSARLTAPVGDGDDPPARGGTARTDAFVTAFTDDLTDRRRFGAALFVGADDSGASRLTAVSGVRAADIRLNDGAMVNAMALINSRLGEVVTDSRQVASLADPAAVELLVFLAFHGTHIRMALERDAAGFDDQLAQARYLQIVSAEPDAFFPFELAYDYPAPNEDAQLCPAAIAALRSPDPDVSCPGEHTHDVVCPFGFWGLAKVIERHAYQPEVPVARDFVLRGNPMRDRDRIPLGPAVLAASDRVNGFTAGAVDEVLSALQESTHVPRNVEVWDDWETVVAECRPALIMLLPHTVFSDVFHAYGLEIGTDARLWSSRIGRDFVPPEDRPVVVALLGCETACAGSIGYEMFPGLLRGAGAEIVIGTFTEILGRHAAPVAGHLIRELYRFCRDEPHGLGEVMLRLRRRLLADGVLTVLALAAFGDADWLIGGADR